MPSRAERRRLDKPTGSAARIARRDRVRGLLTKVRISPAMIGMVAVMAAGLGTFASAGTDTVEGNLTNAGYETAGLPHTTDAQKQAVDSGVDVSRSFDRPELEQQTEQQVTQRTKALQQVDHEITAAAEIHEREEKARAQKAEKIRAQKEAKRRKQWVLPVAGYRLTAQFGQQSSLWSSGAHTGLDFAGPSGTKIVSMAAGTVTSAEYDGSYGNRTVVALADGTEVSYSHQSSFEVEAGDQVQPGELIGYTGATGNVTGPHLHLEVELPGLGQTDPEPVMRAHGITP